MDVSKADWYLNKLLKYLNDLKKNQNVSKPNVTNLFNKDNDGK